MFIMLCVRFLHIVAMLFVGICLLNFLDIIIYMGRLYNNNNIYLKSNIQCT